MKLLLLILFSYLLGSISFAYLFTKFLKGKDIRLLGDGNPGAANVARQVGKLWGILVWLGDTLKAMLAMSVAKFSGIHDIVLLALVGVAAIIGHCRPVFLKFKGGKGAATTGGAFFFLAPKMFPVVLLFWFVAQKINPRDPKIVLSELAISLLALFFLYPDAFPKIGLATILFIAVSMLVNQGALKEMMTR